MNKQSWLKHSAPEGNLLADPGPEPSPPTPNNGLPPLIRFQTAEVFTSLTNEHVGLTRRANARMKQLTSTRGGGLPSFACLKKRRGKGGWS